MEQGRERLLGFHAQDVIGRPCRDVLGGERCLQDRRTECRVIGMGPDVGVRFPVGHSISLELTLGYFVYGIDFEGQGGELT